MKSLQCSALVLACLATVPTQSKADFVPTSECATLSLQIGAYDGYKIFLEAGDTLHIAVVSGMPGLARVSSPYAEPSYLSVPSTFVAPETGGYAVSNDGGYAFMAMEPYLIAPSVISVTCTPAGTGNGAGQANANAQSSNILDGIEMADAGRGGGAQASKTNLFAGVAGDNGAFLWGHVDYANFSGAADGDSLGVTLGIDRTYGDVRYGLVLSHETSDLNGDKVRSLAFGPYVAGSAGALDVDAYVAFGRVNYDATSLVGKRVQYGLRATGEVVTALATLRPMAQVTGYSEDLNGDTNTATQLSLGSRIEFAETAGGMLPYLNLAFEANRATTAGVTTEFTAPRVGLGIRNEIGAGVLSLDLDFGEVADGIRDAGINIAYSQDF